MSPSPYKRAPRLKIDLARHEVGDIVTVGRRRWIIRTINGDQVHLTAANASPAIDWNTTLANLPAPTPKDA